MSLRYNALGGDTRVYRTTLTFRCLAFSDGAPPDAVDSGVHSPSHPVQ